jgi:hypothetical protein
MAVMPFVCIITSTMALQPFICVELHCIADIQVPICQSTSLFSHSEVSAPAVHGMKCLAEKRLACSALYWQLANVHITAGAGEEIPGRRRYNTEQQNQTNKQTTKHANKQY